MAKSTIITKENELYDALITLWQGKELPSGHPKAVKQTPSQFFNSKVTNGTRIYSILKQHSIVGQIEVKFSIKGLDRRSSGIIPVYLPEKMPTLAMVRKAIEEESKYRRKTRIENREKGENKLELQKIEQALSKVKRTIQNNIERNRKMQDDTITTYNVLLQKRRELKS